MPRPQVRDVSHPPLIGAFGFEVSLQQIGRDRVDFHTVKSQPDYPVRFVCYEDASGFCRRTFHWYNHAHHHSGIAMLTPAQLHCGHTQQIWAERQRVLDGAYARTPNVS